MRRRTLLSSSGGIDIDPTAGRKTIGGYEVVDLGLPSKLLWATCNVGANSETDYGDYYKYGFGATKYEDGQSDYTGTENPLSSTADTATQVMGSGWRMPTSAETQELIKNTNYTWVTNFNGSGINGGIYISKRKPKAYVFFPAAGYYSRTGNYGIGVAGYYWSSTPSDSENAYYLYSSTRYFNDIRINPRQFGFSVRGVHA